LTFVCSGSEILLRFGEFIFIPNILAWCSVNYEQDLWSDMCVRLLNKVKEEIRSNLSKEARSSKGHWFVLKQDLPELSKYFPAGHGQGTEM